jgi:hypothetical protein
MSALDVAQLMLCFVSQACSQLKRLAFLSRSSHSRSH